MKRYKRIPWSSVVINEELDDKLTNYLETTDVSSNYIRIRCKPCNIVLFKKIKLSSYNDWYSVREQKHFDSDEHKQNDLLCRLAGEYDGS